MPDGDSLIGTVLDGKYSVDRLLGRGGMGEVYAGTHVALGRTVAIKVLHSEMSVHQSFVARFEREARTTAMLEHPNAVHVHDFGTIGDGSRYLVMEYIEGVTLRDILRANSKLPTVTAVDLISQAAGAVNEAHVRGIIHRDLKPENMMVRSDANGRPFLKVVDFGLAKMLENTASLLTNATEIVGTPKYMAPEQFQGMPVDGRADVYALACVLFELLTGRTPYEGTMIEIVGQHVYAEIPALALGDADVPEGVEAAIHRALAKKPDERTSTAQLFAEEVTSAISGLEPSWEPLLVEVTVGNTPPATSGPSDVTEMPGVGIESGQARRTAATETLAGAYATSSVGTDNATVFVDIPRRGRRAWSIPVAVGAIAVLLFSSLAWQEYGFGASGQTGDDRPAQPHAEMQPAVDAGPAIVPAPGPASAASSPGPAVAPTEAATEKPAAVMPAEQADPKPGEPGDIEKAPEPEKKDGRGVLPTVGEKTKDAVVGTGRHMKRLGGKIRRGIPGLKPKKNEPR